MCLLLKAKVWIFACDSVHVQVCVCVNVASLYVCMYVCIAVNVRVVFQCAPQACDLCKRLVKVKTSPPRNAQRE